MTDEIIDTAVGAIILAISVIIVVKLLFPGISVNIVNDIFSVFVKAVIWIILIAVIIRALQDI